MELFFSVVKIRQFRGFDTTKDYYRGPPCTLLKCGSIAVITTQGTSPTTLLAANALDVDTKAFAARFPAKI